MQISVESPPNSALANGFEAIWAHENSSSVFGFRFPKIKDFQPVEGVNDEVRVRRFCWEEEVKEKYYIESVEDFDIVIRIPPKKRTFLKARIINTKKAFPKIVEPDWW